MLKKKKELNKFEKKFLKQCELISSSDNYSILYILLKLVYCSQWEVQEKQFLKEIFIVIVYVNLFLNSLKRKNYYFLFFFLCRVMSLR